MDNLEKQWLRRLKCDPMEHSIREDHVNRTFEIVYYPDAGELKYRNLGEHIVKTIQRDEFFRSADHKAVNVSNHPSAKWGEDQKQALCEAGAMSDGEEWFCPAPEILDIPFPAVNPEWNKKQVQAEAERVAALVDEAVSPDLYDSNGNLVGTSAIHVMGESGLVYALVSLLIQRGFLVLHSTTERVAVERPDGTKESIFKFKRFRQY